MAGWLAGRQTQTHTHTHEREREHLAPVGIRETQTKTTVRHHFTATAAAALEDRWRRGTRRGVQRQETSHTAARGRLTGPRCGRQPRVPPWESGVTQVRHLNTDRQRPEGSVFGKAQTRAAVGWTSSASRSGKEASHGRPPYSLPVEHPEDASPWRRKSSEKLPGSGRRETGRTW